MTSVRLSNVVGILNVVGMYLLVIVSYCRIYPAVGTVVLTSFNFLILSGT